MSELTPTTRALLRAAREEGPGAAGRAQIWSGVTASTAGTGLSGGAAAKAAAASAGTAKLFVMGALLGSAITVGVAAMVLGVGAPRLKPDPTVLFADSPGRGEDLAPAPAAAAPALRPGLAPSLPQAGPGRHNARVHSPGEAAHQAAGYEDSLGREAELVAEARGAVVRGEPQSALNALHVAQALPAHAMEPEELSLEVRALRELGRLDEANATDARLRARFPDHALAR